MDRTALTKAPRDQRSKGGDRKMERRANCGLNRNHDLVQKSVAWAITELRTRMEWNQGQLAVHIGRYSDRGERLPPPAHETVSRWENGTQAPSLQYRAALAKIARSEKQSDLAVIFEAAPVCWELVVAVVRSGITNA